MQLVEQHIIKPSHPIYEELDRAAMLSKNLYNQALYRVRQQFFKDKTYLKYPVLDKILSREKQTDYTALPAKVSQWVLKQVDNNFVSFFGSLKSPKVNHKVRLPHYLAKDGRNLLTYTIQAISKRSLKKSYLKLSGGNGEIKITHTNVQQVRVTPKNGFYLLEVIYNQEEKVMKDNGNYVGVDIGVGNLATCGGNTIKPFIINGKPLKSINQYYNKKLAKLRSRRDKCQNKKVNLKKIRSLTNKRNNKVKDYMHKASRMLVNRLVSENVSKIVIGHNKEWKQDSNMGKRNNQNFVQIPFNQFIEMVTYKAKLEGITVIVREESHTSKCSFLDNEPICHHSKYAGRRIKRGLFRSSDGRLINADLNGALNILRKEVPNAYKCNGIEVCSMPTVLTVK